MPLTQSDIQLVRDSLATASTAELFSGSTLFYDRLFAREPDLKAMFRDDLEGQGMRFMSTLRTIVGALDVPGGLDQAMVELAATHRLMGVRKEMFATMQEALVETFSALLGDAFTPKLETAWRNAYGEIADAMIAAGGIVSDH